MPVANFHYLSELLGPLNVIPDAQQAAIVTKLDPDDPETVKAMIREHLLPAYRELTEETVTRYKNNLRYYLSTNSAPFDRLISEQQDSPLRPPQEPRLLFLWIWESMFPEEDYLLTEVTEWQEQNDPCAAISYRKL